MRINYKLSLLFLIIIGIFLVVLRPHTIRLKPIDAEDSDGSPSSDIINRINVENDFEDVILKVNPHGFITVKEWGDETIPSNVKKVIIHVLWKTDTNRGAGNIYVGYSTDGGESFIETGPFDENETEQDTKIELSKHFDYDLSEIQVRWRGEDLDYRLPARGYVSFMMEVYT